MSENGNFNNGILEDGRPEDTTEPTSPFNYEEEQETPSAQEPMDNPMEEVSNQNTLSQETTTPPNNEDNADSKQTEPVYSTRGRTAERGPQDPLERLARDALGDLAHMGREKETVPAVTSFLSETLTEEERRTRGRYIPEVEGMHALRKQEIKSDLAMARALQAKKKRSRDEEMEVDDEPSMSEDDRASDILRTGAGAGTRTIPVGATELTIPSPVFLPPAISNGDTVKKPTPREVEAVTAFNPPRPPESIGAKKKHRMMRWERRPADIEIDLNNYRKTVQRTREELKNAEAELERRQIVEDHMRRHFFKHVQCLNDEYAALTEELTSLQQECINAADLITSRTRSRGAGKGGHVMREVLSVLQQRGAELGQRGLTLHPIESTEPIPRGVGGVGALSFREWNRSTVIEPKTMAQAWILPGDIVHTPYGNGTVIAVSACSKLDPSERPNEVTRPQNIKSSIDAHSSESEHIMKMSPSESIKTPILAPRITVKLPFGMGFFSVDSIESHENPAAYSDERLALRWKGIIETANSFGYAIDIEAMAEIVAGDMDHGVEGAMDVEETNKQEVSADNIAERQRRLLPFGAGMWPSAYGRGDQMHTATLPELDKILEPVLYKGCAVLGSKDNMGVPSIIREREETREERVVLQAKILQLKNKLYHQRRIRVLNERTHATSQERSARVEHLVSEMRSDLKSLKNRLDEEVREMGVSEEKSDSVMASFYNSLDTKHSGLTSPPKRPRKEFVDKQLDDDMDDSAHQQSLQVA